MHIVSREKFEEIVMEGMQAIPEKFLKKIDNVAVVVEETPTSAQSRKLHIHKGWTLFGLYEGVPQTKRGINYGAVLPDKITIFQKPIEAQANNEENLKKIVKNTVWHEIAHHFGMDEQQVRESEKRKKHKL